jgi:hypothetical protein
MKRKTYSGVREQVIKDLMWVLGAESKTAMENTAKCGLRFSYPSLDVVWVIRSRG